MPQKIFISYRREDTAATALGIGQYLERTFGHKNVFIDIDMRAGIKFPTVLGQRLAACRVMLVLIGPGWLNALDGRGGRRLDDPDDWVRLEISQALKRNIVVIPVLVDGTQLPARDALPDDIRGLLDHQAVSVTVPGFRNEMSGLVRDLRAISRPRQWKRYGSIALGVLLLLTAAGLGQALGFSATVERIRNLLFSQVSPSAMNNGVWSGAPGEWVYFTFDNYPAAYFYKSDSVKVFGDYAAYTARYPLYPSSANAVPQGAYSDDTTVFDCKKSASYLIEKVVYNKIGDVAYRYKWATLETFNLLPPTPNPPGSILALAAPIMCSEEIRRPLLLRDEITQNKLSHLAMAPAGDGEFFYGGKKQITGSNFDIEVLVLLRQFQDRKFQDDHPGREIIGLFQGGYRTVAQAVQLSCRDKKMRVPIYQIFNSQNVLLATHPAGEVSMSDVPPSAPFSVLFDNICGPRILQVHGTYEGMNHFTYKNGGEGDQQISLIVEQNNANVTVGYQTANRTQGKGAGTLTGNTVMISIKGLAPECPGSLEASLEFGSDAVNWSFKGEDCNGPMEGRGTAKKTKS